VGVIDHLMIPRPFAPFLGVPPDPPRHLCEVEALREMIQSKYQFPKLVDLPKNQSQEDLVQQATSNADSNVRFSALTDVLKRTGFTHEVLSAILKMLREDCQTNINGLYFLCCGAFHANVHLDVDSPATTRLLRELQEQVSSEVRDDFLVPAVAFRHGLRDASAMQIASSLLRSGVLPTGRSLKKTELRILSEVAAGKHPLLSLI